MNSMLNRLKTQCTPLEWAIEATARAAKLTGTDEGRLALVEANRYRAWADERALWEREVERLRAAGVQASVPTALERFKEIETEEPSLRSESPLERLRFFCSLAMHGQDWLDVEQFFDAVSPRGVPPSDGGQSNG